MENLNGNYQDFLQLHYQIAIHSDFVIRLYG